MSDDHIDYRPRSPDLSAYTPQPPRLPSYDQSSGFPAGYPLTHRGSYDASPYFSPQTAQTPQHYFGQQPHAPIRQSYSPQAETFTPRAQSLGSQSFWPPPQVQAQPQRTPSSFAHPPPPNFPIPEQTMPRRRKSEEDEEDYTPEAIAPAAGRRSTKKRKSENNADASATVPAGAGPSQGIEVKTKFPVARIKRIMQADEDVGKVAQATPTAVSKALELFMITLVTKAATEAKDRSSKRITAAHLKQAVVKDETLDFLHEIIEKVVDPTEKKGRGGRSESAEPMAEEEGGKKKRAVGVGRRKKVEADD